MTTTSALTGVPDYITKSQKAEMARAQALNDRRDAEQRARTAQANEAAAAETARGHAQQPEVHDEQAEPEPDAEPPRPSAPADMHEAAYWCLVAMPNAVDDTGRLYTAYGINLIGQSRSRYEARFGIASFARDHLLIQDGATQYTLGQGRSLFDENGCTVSLDEYRRLVAEGMERYEQEQRKTVAKGFFTLNDAGNAELFAHRLGDRFRYVQPRREWLAWNGDRWAPDANAATATREAMRILREAVNEVQSWVDDDAKRKAATAHYNASQNAARIRAMLELARVLAPITDDGTGWDEDPDLIGVRNGIVQFDPDTGKATLRRGRPEDKVTKSTAVAYDPDAKCPAWLKFLSEVFEIPEEEGFAEETKLKHWISKYAGYCATGHTRSQVHATCTGVGANGKSVMWETVADVLGDYAHHAPHHMLTGRTRQGPNNEVADLLGKRLLIASEVPLGAAMNEQLVKSLTGGEKTTARHLFGSNFEFTPVAKIVTLANHRPPVRDVSDGYWRRTRLVPYPNRFDYDTVPPRDDTLKDRLRAEWPGILAWLVKHASLWYEEGLSSVPAAITDMTAAYRAENDTIGSFIEQHCVQSGNASVGATDLYRAYTEWCGENGGAVSQRAFGDKLKSKFTSRRSTGGRVVYDGIGLPAAAIGNADTGPDGEDEADMGADKIWEQ
jgi:putative DNA primase/helicase